MNTIENLKWRYAVKKFDNNQSVADEKVEILKEAFNLTATSYGLQPIKMLVVQNKEIQASLVPFSWNQQQVLQASHLLILCIDTNLSGEDVKNYFQRVKEIRNTPDDIINPFKEFLVGKIDSQSKGELIAWAKNQAYLAMGNLLTVCAMEQIDSCPMEGFEPDKYDVVLNLSSKNLSSVLVLPIGVRAEDDFMKDQKKVRKNLSETVLEVS